MKFNIFLWILVNLFGYVNTIAQQYEWLSNDFPGSHFLKIEEVNGKFYGIVSNGARYFADPDILYQLSIYEIQPVDVGEPNLELTEVNTIQDKNDYATIIAQYVKETGLWLIAQSNVITQGLQNYRILLCDESFEVINMTSIDVPGYPIPFNIDTYNGKTIILGSIIAPPRDEIFYFEYDHNKPFDIDSIQIRQSEPKPMFWITSMNFDQRTGHMLTFYFNGLAVLDSNLYQVKRFDHTSHISTSDHGHIMDIGEYYYSHGALRQSWQTGYRWLVFQKYDTAFNILNTDTLGISGQDNYPFIMNSIDFNGSNFIVGGHLDGVLNHINFDEVDKKFYLAKYDEDLNQIWYKEYGGDRPYLLIGLKLMEDGSSFAYGSIKDSLNLKPYAYILHVDENGDILSSTTFPEIDTSIKVLSPGKDALYILNPDAIEASILMYDLNGREAFHEELLAGSNIFSTHKLPAGIYPYTIQQGKKVIQIGKWVKQ